jgi:ABC-type uncharacterized transport system ATPase subunit
VILTLTLSRHRSGDIKKYQKHVHQLARGQPVLEGTNNMVLLDERKRVLFLGETTDVRA